jgi:hypothetical protein
MNFQAKKETGINSSSTICRLVITLSKSIGHSRAIVQAVNCHFPHRGGLSSVQGQILWDLWWTKVALRQIFSECFGSPSNILIPLIFPFSSVIRD